MMRFFLRTRQFSTAFSSKLEINEKHFEPDNFTNVTPRVLQYLNRNIYLTEGHPLSLIRQRIINYFIENFKGRTGNALFSVYEKLDPIVSLYQNFDSLLVPKDHASRSKSDCFYINNEKMLRSHMTAHQSELITMGLNSFLMVGDVYRRDDIDPKHYPVFHQLDGVRLFSPQELFTKIDDGKTDLQIKKTAAPQERSENCQGEYTTEASQRVEDDLKNTLLGLTKKLFGLKIKHKWTSSHFPFTHPSWELEIELQNGWLEVLGCGIIEHEILKKAGCENRIGWAFGLGLERLAMILYNIPDIRLFWSEDSGFLNQFRGKSFDDEITYKSVSRYPQCINHISFWIPKSYEKKDFYDLVRNVGGDVVEQINLIDEYLNPKNNRVSHCYSIIYRHMEKTFTQKEVNELHEKISNAARENLNVELR